VPTDVDHCTCTPTELQQDASRRYPDTFTDNQASFAAIEHAHMVRQLEQPGVAAARRLCCHAARLYQLIVRPWHVLLPAACVQYNSMFRSCLTCGMRPWHDVRLSIMQDCSPHLFAPGTGDCGVNLAMFTSTTHGRCDHTMLILFVDAEIGQMD
jgi:hypothetical protein